MKKKIFSILSTTLVLFMLLSTNVFMAASKTETITLLDEQVWNVRPVIKRSGAYYDTYVKCNAVYPRYGGLDTFSKIKVCIRDTSYFNTISDEKTIYEGAGNYVLTLKNGELNNKEIRFAFCGNNPAYEAKADVYYDAR